MSIEDQIAREAAKEIEKGWRVTGTYPVIIAAIKRAVAIEREIVAQAIEAEPELPGDMPEQMWKAVQNDKNAAIELLRITVRLTKQGIRDRLENPMQKEPK